MNPPIVAVVGYSNSGKTTVAAAIIRCLSEQGHRIAAVKHAPHGHRVDKKGSDSDRLYEAGAVAVVVASPGQVTSVVQTGGDMPLEQIVASLGPGYDLVVAEGFKESSVPKVLVTSGSESTPRVQDIIAVVGEGGGSLDVPRYTLQETDGLAQQVRAQVMAKDTAKGETLTELVVDGVPIKLSPFPADILANVIRGVLTSLKDVSPNPKTINISLSQQ